MTENDYNEKGNSSQYEEDSFYWDNLLKLISKNLKGVVFLIWFQALLRVTILFVIWLILFSSESFHSQKTPLWIILGVYVYIELGSVMTKVGKIKEQYKLLNSTDHERNA